MADYYPLIARAIAGLDPNAPGEARRALYARARTALIQQLRGVQPPLSESEITRERLSLEEAVRKVESEAAQRAREASRPGGAAAARGSRANARPPEPGPADTAARPRPPADPRPPRNLRPDAPPPAPPRPQNPPGPETQAPPPRPGPPRRGPEGAPPPVPPAAPGVRGFRDITADADDLGRAAAQASRNARKTYANVPSPSPEFDRLEPSLENRGGDPEAPYSYDESIEEAERYTPQPPQGPPPQRSRGGNGEREPKKPPRVGSMFPFKTAIVIGILLILVGTGILFRQQATTLVSSLFKSSAPVEAPKDAASTPASKKITDRVGQPSSSGETVAPVAQRVVLYDEDPSDPKGKQYVGSVVWRTEQVKGSGNQKPDIAVRADIDIPDRKFKMTMSFRRNTDSSLPASHTAELTFILPQDFANGGVGNVPGILMKSNEQARGTPLAGLAVKVTDGFFLVGLSNVDADRSRNLQLLKERSWFDVPLVYTNQRRAIIAIEKGAPGERAFNEAFAAWGE
ncbi:MULTISPECIES: hypothetical protein [Bradyrhizobium]|jgi:hypothetical protein|uniref:hypothetical protein n=1 Tax=Bradyrhizobium TaxID=374 RepID=UPI000485DCB5|nr:MULTISPECIES: hypothetical protein [Bradyrhizobium]MCS3446357.1 hypothetical protein [Bradyrhizobium elkanii]MCS3562510.1 hypothetical protein [Bradyrhizobium elkanii]MCW2147653.1 hypothetical protein [Bradyrhizobium elkanii]MCW2353262.1 hypothetical protein [Bradyrhizobium elkanii]MCW2371380.1 hypothetical protein [Bradyrhizobium elkanii]